MKEDSKEIYIPNYKAINPESLLKPSLDVRLEEIEKFNVNWYMFSQTGALTESEVEYFINYEGLSQEKKEEFFLTPDHLICEIIMKLLSRISVDRVIQYLLFLLDRMIKPDFVTPRHFIKILNTVNFGYWPVFVSLLNREDSVISQLASKIMSKIEAYSSIDVPENILVVHASWILKQLEIPVNEYLLDDICVCQLVLRVSKMRMIFKNLYLIDSLIKNLKKSTNFQLQYQIIFCLWLAAFEPEIVDVLVEHKIVSLFSDILKDASRNKVVRIVLATCRNIAEKARDQKAIHSLFIYNKYLPVFQYLNKKVFEDEELNEDLTMLNNLCLKTVQDLSNFEEFSGEILSGKLDWSPVHKSDKFWRENAIRLTEKNNEILTTLIKILQTSQDALALAVACHDLGEFIRCYPRGKLIFEKLGGKDAVFALLTHTDPTVKYEALLALQKLLIQNWDFLGKQLKGYNDHSGASTKTEPIIS